MSTYAWMALGAVVVVAGIEVWLLREFVVLRDGKAPITSLTRAMIQRWPGRTLAVTHLLAFIVGGLLAHFVWDARCG